MRLLIDYLQLDAELHRLIRGESNADRCLDMLGIGSATGKIARSVGPSHGRSPVSADRVSGQRVAGCGRLLPRGRHAVLLPCGRDDLRRGAVDRLLGHGLPSGSTRCPRVGENGDRSNLPGRPGGCFAQIGPVPAYEPQSVGRITGEVDCRWADPRHRGL